MSNSKSEIITFIKGLPDSFTVNQIIYKLIEKSLNDREDNRGRSA